MIVNSIPVINHQSNSRTTVNFPGLTDHKCTWAVIVSGHKVVVTVVSCCPFPVTSAFVVGSGTSLFTLIHHLVHVVASVSCELISQYLTFDKLSNSGQSIINNYYYAL